MFLRSLTAASVLLVAAPLFADSLDDAEARRRGVPVSQVQAENALTRERQKNAALERQIADLQKQIAALSAKAASQPAPGSPAAASRAATPADGPRQSSPLYDGFVTRYLSGDWNTLAADLNAKQKEIATLPPDNAADLAYIKQTLAECRPAWWDQCKAGKNVSIRQTVWNLNVTINYQNQRASHTSGTQGNLVAAWPASYMDSRDAFGPGDSDLDLPPNNFRRGDAISGAIWEMVGGLATMWNSVPRDTLMALSDSDKQQFVRWGAFRQFVAGAYFATPAGRRYELFGACVGLQSSFDHRADYTARRPLAAALLAELATHKDRYTHIRIERILGLDRFPVADRESNLAKPVWVQLANTNLTLDEDRHLRDMIKTLADANADWKNSKIVLPNGLFFELTPGGDDALVAERVKVLTVAP
jgi:hypothetical protein